MSARAMTEKGQLVVQVATTPSPTIEGVGVETVKQAQPGWMMLIVLQ